MPPGYCGFVIPDQGEPVSSLLSSAARAAVLPAAFTGPWATVLVPLLIIAATCAHRDVTVQVR